MRSLRSDSSRREHQRVLCRVPETTAAAVARERELRPLRRALRHQREDKETLRSLLDPSLERGCLLKGVSRETWEDSFVEGISYLSHSTMLR